jgi:hypothetical protein
VSLIPVANLPPVSLILAAILTPVPLTPVANLPPVSLIPMMHLDSRTSPRIFEKNLKWSKCNTLGRGGNGFMKKTRSKKSRDTKSTSRERESQRCFKGIVSRDEYFLKVCNNK